MQPIKEAKFLSMIFFEPLILFLIFYVSSYLVLIQTYRTNTIPAAPEVISPVRLALQRWIAFEKLYRCFAFQYTHDFRYR